MTLSDKNVYLYILGGLIADPNKLTEFEDLSIDDFDVKLCKIIFSAIKSLVVDQKYTKIDPLMIETELQKHSAIWTYYERSSGTDYLNNCIEYGAEMVSQFAENYNTLKKLALLRELKRRKYDISKFYKDDLEISSVKEEAEIVERLNNATVETIFNEIEGDLNDLKTVFMKGGRSRKQAANGIVALIDDLKARPNLGPELNGNIFSASVRGARSGCFYLKSASSGCGKTRTSVFDACKLAYPEYYSEEHSGFVEEIDNSTGEIREPLKVLFIVTEMDSEEIQTIILAYLSKVNEEHIITGAYENDEEDRVRKAAEIMVKYQDWFMIESISDPSVVTITSTIKMYAMLESVKYVFFDYIHSTPALLAEFAAAKVREDVSLMLMSNQLKQLAHDYNLFIFSATQVNSEGMGQEPGFRGETAIRGSKAIADKADVAYVMSRVSEKERMGLYDKLRASGKPVPVSEVPNFVIDIYKNRRGRFKLVRIWLVMDLGNGQRKDLFMTTADNELIDFIDTYNAITILPVGGKKEV